MRAGDTFQTWVSEGPDQGHWDRWSVLESALIRTRREGRGYVRHREVDFYEVIVRNIETDEHQCAIVLTNGEHGKSVTYFEREFEGRFFYDSRLISDLIEKLRGLR